jgi:hypothetical protein
MGTPRNEVSSFRKAGDRPAGRAIPSAGAPDAGKARRLARHFLQMVRPLSDRRAEALEDRSPRPDRVRNRIPDDVPGQIVQLALDEPTYLKRTGVFTITKLLPPLGAEWQYRIKSAGEVHERVASEPQVAELEKPIVAAGSRLSSVDVAAARGLAADTASTRSASCY